MMWIAVARCALLRRNSCPTFSPSLLVVHSRRVWTKEEDEAIRGLVARYGTRSWSVIADHIAKDFEISVSASKGP